MDKKAAKEFFDLMKSHVALYTEMKRVETEKMADIAGNHFEKLDDYVKKEEALLLKSRGLELSRSRFFKKYNLTDTRMNGVIAVLPEEMRPEGEQFYKALSELVFDIKRINERCESMSELRLHRIENAVNRLQNTPKSESSYNMEAKQQASHSSVMSKKV